jgi:anti-sigma B factor antagonist
LIDDLPGKRQSESSSRRRDHDGQEQIPMLNSGLLVFRQIEPDVTVVDFKGRLTSPAIMVAEAESFVKKRIERGSKKIVLELSKVEFLDSSAVGMLMVCWSAMQKAGGTMVIAGAGGYVKQVLESVCLHRTIRMYADLASACKSMEEPAAPA